MATSIHNLGDIWHRMGMAQRVLLLGVVLGCVGAATFLVGWASEPEYVMLFGGLEPAEASRIVEKLRDGDTSYKLRDGGTTVMVPEDKVYSLRLSLAGEGLTGGGQEGYQILDRSGLGQSPSRTKIDHNRAIQGELAKTIKAFDVVQDCRVHISRPERMIFDRGKNVATAAVSVKMKGGRGLSNSQIASILNVVAGGGGGGLVPENVMLVDARTGNSLSGGSKEKGSASDGADRYRSGVESSMEQKVLQLLEMAVGRGRVQVSVTANVMRESTIVDTVVHAKGVETRKKTMEDTTTPAGGNTSGTKVEKNEEEIITLPNTTTTHREEPAGKVISRSVGVIVDLTPPKAAEGEDATAPKMLSVADVQELVVSSLNLDISGKKNKDGILIKDNLTVKEATLIGTAMPELDMEPAGMFSSEIILEMLRQGSLGVLVIGVLIALRMLGGKNKRAQALSGGEAVGALEGAAAGDVSALLPGVDTNTDPQMLKSQISSALQDNPDEVKRLFLSWAEER